jgi:hypothetical protein
MTGYPSLCRPIARESDRVAQDIGSRPKESRDMCGKGKDEALLKRIADMMAAGLETQTEPFPETEKEFGEILTELRQLAPDDLRSKLVISGFVDHPYGPDQQRCFECMYYLVHRKWCDLPELSVPVEHDWWCRLWRI